MNRPFVPFVKSLLVALLAISAAASAAETHGAPAAVKADPAKGEALFTNGDAARNITACVSCHGAGGNSTITQNPRLASQLGTYVNKQLHDFRTDARMNPIMSPIAKAMTDEDILNVAAYLTAQPAKPNAARNKDTIALGKKIYRGGIAEKNVPACASCHGANGAGIPAQYPRIAGQHQDYAVAQLTNFRTNARKNSPQMQTIAKRLSDDEMKAVSDYVAGMK
jgi:cytochrome c553